MKKIILAVLLLCCIAPLSARAQAVKDVPILSAERLSGAVGVDYVYTIDPLAPEKWDPKVGVILAYRLTKELSVGGQAWAFLDDIDKPKELKVAVRWRVF